MSEIIKRKSRRKESGHMEDLRKQVLDYMENRQMTPTLFCQKAQINYRAFKRWLNHKHQFTRKTLDKIKKQINLTQNKCNPPYTCFTCPLPECDNDMVPTKEEYMFSRGEL